MTIKNSPPTRKSTGSQSSTPLYPERRYQHRFSQNPLYLFMDNAGTGGEFGHLPQSLVASCLVHQQQFLNDVDDQTINDLILALSGLNKIEG